MEFTISIVNPTIFLLENKSSISEPVEIEETAVFILINLLIDDNIDHASARAA